ncbi:MAG: Gfo/Idh/MocA family oxidoreductase [Phycisphaerae bacterium]|nr:Gfo/Idh/MocA family oxidoreductase [Phycisphaerae bacterium]HON91498.1 Gfo/Idh/MocA family oxidoreductase [Sedimentisphaerales bacterium]
MHTHYDRRVFLRLGAAGAAAWAVGGTTFASEVRPLETVRVGLVGIGGRGTVLLKILLGLEGVQVKAVCDIIEDRVVRAQGLVTAAGQAKPNGYSRGDTDFQRLCESEELDLVVNAVRPWKWHTPISVAAMNAGKHTATEVPAAETIEECWQLVETAEKTRRHCVILENCCYFRNVMLVHHMLRKGLFGELRHCEAGYQHYYQKVGLGAPRSADPLVQTGNSYPTHAIGPVAQWMDINRGNRFDYLVSMSADGTRGNPGADINTSLIRTVNGQTITLYYDTKLPRPYDLIYRVQGTQGIYSATLDQIYIEGRSPKNQTWEPMDEYYKQYEHPLWKAWGEKALSHGGHGGADWLTLYRLIQALRTGAAPDMDVYDAATWSCITELSEKSVAKRSSPMDFPDFTRGRWKTTPPIGILGA